MIKVIFKSGNEATFHGVSFTHHAEHHMFYIPSLLEATIMIPDHAVECIGIWDKQKEQFYQVGY